MSTAIHSKEDVISAIAKMTVMDLVELIGSMEEKFGVSAAAAVAVAAAPAAGGAPAVEEQTAFAVLLTEVGPNKLNVIKVVREVTGLGLKEAKDLVEQSSAAPQAVKEALPKAEAEGCKKKLEEAGAKVLLK